MTTLRLYLRPGWPDGEPGLPWALLGAQGELSAQGDSVPASWPRADRCELILPAGRTLFSQLRLPDSVKQPAGPVIGFALEEGLANDPAANLYALGAVGADGARPVAVTEAYGVRRAVAMLKTLGRLCDRIVPEECLLPLPREGGWSMARVANRWLLRLATGQAVSLPLCEVEVERTLLAQLAGDQLPAQLLLCGQDAVDRVSACLPGWQGESVHQTDHDWRQGRLQGGLDFASGELAANRRWRHWGPSLRQAGVLLGGLLAAQLLLTLGQSGWYAWQKHSLSQQIREVTRPWLGAQAMPGSSALPMTRAVDKLRLGHGQPARDDAVELMGDLAAVSGQALQVRRLEYEAGRLKLQVTEVPADTLRRWRALLAGRQIRLEANSSQPGVKELIVMREP